MFCFINLTPQTPPSVIHGWKATDLIYEMVKTKKYFFHPVRRQIFGDALKQTFCMISKLVITCVNAFVEILQSLQCKIFQYSFLGQYPMKFQDFFFLCQIEQPAWLQLDHRKLRPSEMRLLSEPCIIKLKKKRKFAFMCDMLL